MSLFGTYGPYKGHHLLVRTVGQMLEASPALPLKLLLVGFQNRSMAFAFLKRLSKIERTAVENRAIQRVVDLKPYYLASDTFVMNTQYPGETFGRVTIEAMGFRLPVLGTDAAGTREIILDGVTGLMHPIGEEGMCDLEKNIRHIMNSPCKAKAMGEAGLDRVREVFTEKQFYDQLAHVLSNVLA